MKPVDSKKNGETQAAMSGGSSWPEPHGDSANLGAEIPLEAPTEAIRSSGVARFRRHLQSYRPSQQPLMTRQAYRFELGHAAFFTVAISMMDGAVISVLARKLFGASPLAFAMIFASLFFANMLSYGWAQYSRGRRKIPLIAGAQGIALLGIASVALLQPEWGAWPLVGLVILVRIALSGGLTVRSAVWRLNYPRSVRAQVTGRLVVVATIVLALAPAAASAALDANQQLYRIVYPLAALIGAMGIWSLTRVRVRREPELLREERQSRDASALGEPATKELEPTDDAHNRSSVQQQVAISRATFWSVLRQDRDYRRYQFWQFVLGFSNIMAQASIILFIADHTKGRPWEFVTSIGMSTVIPFLMPLLLIPIWSRYLDRVGVVRFRTRHSLVFLVTNLLSFVAVGLAWQGAPYLLWLGILGLSRISQGVSQAGGMLAWQLGHHDFADRRLVSLYMGIHVTLTGVRGIIAPFVGTYLFAGWSAWSFAGGDFIGVSWPAISIGGFAGLGPVVFLMSFAMTTVAWRGYVRLDRDRHGQKLED